METQLSLNNLLELCNKMRSLIDKCINNQKPSTTITLLVGLTGAGKSTFFNFLCGAEFVYNGKHLELKDASDQFSIMKGGMVSVTKEPKFYMNVDKQHLLIDYPGFQDTTGEVDQLLFDLLFNKIVSMGEVKIIYVINNPDNNLPTRGTDLQAFISQLENPNFNLLLNCYNEDLDDEELINEIKEELKQAKFHSNIDKIIVQRKAKKGNLDKLFKDNDRQIFWNQIQAMNKVQIKPRNIPKSELISEFLISEATKKIQENGKIMLDFFSRKTDEAKLQENEEMLANLKLFKDLMQNDKSLTALEWFEYFINICEKLTNSCNQQQKTIGKEFISLFQYFEQFKEFINGYQQLQTINEFGKQAFKQIEILIDTKIELIERWKQAEQERQKAEQERQKAVQERQKAEQEKQEAEQERQKAVQQRQKAEQDKQMAELQKQKAEQERQKAVQEKQEAEQERQKAVQEKQEAEQERQKAEQERQKAEQEKQEAEQERQKAVQEKQEAEQERQKAEQERQKAEQEKQEAEQERQKAVQQRQKAEQERQEAEQERQKAVQQRQKAEQEKQEAEQERQKAEQEKQEAEQERQKAVQQRQKAEQDKQSQQREIEIRNLKYQFEQERDRQERKLIEIQKEKEMEIQKARMEHQLQLLSLQQQEHNKLENEKRWQKEKQEKQEKQEENKYYLKQKLEDCQIRLNKLKEEKEKYVEGQKGIFMQIVGGDSFWEKNKILSRFEDEIKIELDREHKIKKELGYFTWF